MCGAGLTDHFFYRCLIINFRIQSIINVYMFDQVLHKVNYPNIIMKAIQL